MMNKSQIIDLYSYDEWALFLEPLKHFLVSSRILRIP